jgi:hypothetical protein
LTVWIIAGLLAMATGLRIGWALVNQQSVVSSAMIVALGSLAVVAALNWPPLTLLVDTALGWPNISVGLSQAALVASAAGSFVMTTSVASTRSPKVTRRWAVVQYTVAAAIAVATLVLFLNDGRGAEMSTKEYLKSNIGLSGEVFDWLVPLLYVLLVLSVVAGVGMRLSNASRRGRALLIFTAGMALLVAASAFFVGRAVGGTRFVGVSTAVTMVVCAMGIVAAGALLPTLEDWVGARRDLRRIAALRDEMGRRHPDIGIGVRPRGPLVFRVAEQLSLISDALYLEGARATQHTDHDNGSEPLPAQITAAEQARAVARWIAAGPDEIGAAFPGRSWLRQPPDCPDRDWILEIADQYRHVTATPSTTGAVTAPADGVARPEA